MNLPRVAIAERRYLTHEQVRLLAEECGPHRLVVLFLAYTGLRFGEMAALGFVASTCCAAARSSPSQSPWYAAFRRGARLRVTSVAKCQFRAS